MTQLKTPRREVIIGRVLATPGALDELHKDDMFHAFFRHASGDWGEVDEEDWNANENALDDGGRLLSAYTDRKGNRFWIITEADRSSTTILLPEEY